VLLGVADAAVVAGLDASLPEPPDLAVLSPVLPLADDQKVI
jgi:hypothetical protein